MKRIVLELTNFCNLSCLPCPRHHINMPMGYISYILWKRVIDQLSPGTILIPFWRGEPLLHPNAVSLLEYAVSRCKILLATNGYFLKRIPIELIEMFEAISISLHDEKSVDAYQWLTRHVILPTVQATVVEGEGFDPPVPNLRRYAQHTKNGEWGRTGKVGFDQSWCKRLDTDLAITWDGRVSRCCYVWQPEPDLDANTMTIEEIWNSDRLKDIRAQYPDEICSRCDQWAGGGKTL